MREFSLVGPLADERVKEIGKVSPGTIVGLARCDSSLRAGMSHG